MAPNGSMWKPGSPLMTTRPDGSRTVLQDGSTIYLRGDGSTPDGDRPFLDRLDLVTMEQERHVNVFFRLDQPEIIAGARRARPAGRTG